MTRNFKRIWFFVICEKRIKFFSEERSKKFFSEAKPLSGLCSLSLKSIFFLSKIKMYPEICLEKSRFQHPNYSSQKWKAKSKPKLHISSDDENFAHINFNKSGEKNGWGLVWFRVTRFFIVSEKCGFEQNLHDCESFWRSCIFVFKMLWNMKL